MKICLVNSYYYPWIGGAERYVRSLSKAMSGLGHQVTVYCSSRPIRPGESLEEGVQIYRMRTPLMLYGTPLTIPPGEFFRRRYDVIHANFPGPYLAAMSSFKGGVEGTPSVITWHNDLPAVTRSASLLVNLHSSLSAVYMHNFRRIIATTRVYTNLSPTLRKYSNKVEVVLNGVDTEMFNPFVGGEVVRQRHNLSNKKVILFVGALTRWHTYKGLDVLITSLRLVRQELSNANLLVVGDGPMRPAYERQVAKEGLSDFVTFAGKVDDATLPTYYAAADVVVLPSKDSSEGFGLVLLEAMACSKPVVASSVGGVPEIVRNEENGLMVEPNEPEGLATAIVAILQDEGVGRSMGQNGRSFAESHDWNMVAKQVESIYEKI